VGRAILIIWFLVPVRKAMKKENKFGPRRPCGKGIREKRQRTVITNGGSWPEQKTILIVSRNGFLANPRVKHAGPNAQLPLKQGRLPPLQKGLVCAE